MSKLSRHEKPLTIENEHGNYDKNPNKITINQHVIPSKHILQWSSDSKMVNLFELTSGEEKSLAASNPYFCVMRLWDQWTETEMLKGNENNFQEQLSLFNNK